MNIGNKKSKLGQVTYGCSFCGKKQDQVRRLIAGPGGVFICNECITLCHDIIGEEDAAAQDARGSQGAGAEGGGAAKWEQIQVGEGNTSVRADVQTTTQWISQGADAGDAPSTTTLVGDGRYVFSPEQGADFLGVHTQTIRSYIRSGKLPAYRLAGERIIRITRANLLALLQPLSPEDEV